MKVVLSRKGFDSKFGGGPSPLIDGRYIVSLPIEYGAYERKRRFSDINIDGINLGQLVESLYPQKRRKDDFCHLDPDLRKDAIASRSRFDDWRPLFGQANAAASHLLSQQVGPGDLFLFFGLFRATRNECFLPRSREMHLIYGWFQVDEVIHDPLNWAYQSENEWARDLPNTYGQWSGKKNIIFIAKKYLDFDNNQTGSNQLTPGAGLFRTFNERLQLSDPNSQLKSQWRLPISLYPDPKSSKSITYLKNAIWEVDPNNEFVTMKPGRTTLWQEAVISGNPDAASWAVSLIHELREC